MFFLRVNFVTFILRNLLYFYGRYLKVKKKIFATLLAAVMTIASTVTAFAAEVPTSFTQVTYKFNCTTFVGEDTITLTATNDSGWIGLIAEGTTHNVTAAGAFDMTVTFQTDMGGWTAEAAKGFANMGYLASANSVANIYKLEGIVIEGVTFNLSPAFEALDASSSTANGLPNIWGVAVGTEVGSSANGSKLVCEVIGQNADTGADILAIMVKWAAADFEEPAGDNNNDSNNAGGNTGDDSNAGGNTSGRNTSGGNASGGNTAGGTDTADVAPVAALVAVAALAAVVVLKKRAVNE